MAELSDKIRHVLTETRVVLPGTQALLGFQLIVLLMDGWDKLPQSSQRVHLAALTATAISAIWLMTPAAYHRIVEGGEETERFHQCASKYLLAAMVVLALGIVGDYYVVARQITGSVGLSAAAAGFLLALFYGLWFVLPLVTRRLKT